MEGLRCLICGFSILYQTFEPTMVGESGADVSMPLDSVQRFSMAVRPPSTASFAP